jgi:hypothetical protein
VMWRMPRPARLTGKVERSEEKPTDAQAGSVQRVLQPRKPKLTPFARSTLRVHERTNPRNGQAVPPSPWCRSFVSVPVYCWMLLSCRPFPPFLTEELNRRKAPSWLHGYCPASPLLQAHPPPSRLRPTSRGAGYMDYYPAPLIAWRDAEGFSSCLACPCHRAGVTTPPKRPVSSASPQRTMLPSPSAQLGPPLPPSVKLGEDVTILFNFHPF